jgi:hypothetical protein
VEVPGEQAARRRIVALQGAAGLSLRALSRALASGGILARNGRPFGPMMLSRIVHNPSLVDRVQAS